MPNKVDGRKSKITFGVFKPVRRVIACAAVENGITETEMFRQIILDAANLRQQRDGKQPFDSEGRVKRKKAA